MPTHTARAQLADLALGRLGPDAAALVEAHVAGCGRCGARLDQERETARLLAHLGQGGPDVSLTAEVARRIDGEGDQSA